MKNIFRIILAGLLLLNMAACGNSSDDRQQVTDSNDNTGGNSTPDTEELTDGLPDKDMEGFSFNVLHHDKSWLTWAQTDLTADEENGELINDAVYKRNRYIEERFNCKLNIVGIPKVSDIFRQTVESGDNEYDLILQYGINVLGNVDYLASFTNIPYLNLDADYWNPNATRIFKVGDKQIAVAGNYTLSYLSGSAMFLYNKTLYEDLNINENLYQLVRDGKWTTDKLFEVAKLGISDLNGDTVMDLNDRVGIFGSVKGFYNALIVGAGINYVEMDKDSYPYFNIPGNEKAIGFMQKLVDATTKEPYLYYTDSTNVDGGGTIKFADGGCFFQTTTTFGVAGYREMEDDFGILPCPKYDEAQEKYYSTTNIGEIATLLRTFDISRAENIGMLLEAMSFYSQQNIVPKYKEVVLQTKFTRDEDSSEMLQYVFDGITFDYGVVVWQDTVSKVFMNKIFFKKSDAIVSTIEGISTRLNSDIDKLKVSVADMP